MQEIRSLQAADTSGARENAALDGLAARVAQGDKAAFEQIYLALADDLYTYVRAQCHNETVAEDIVANVFLKAWRSAKRYRTGTGRFRPWIFAIARNELRDYWRKHVPTQPIVGFESTLPAESPEVDSPERGREARALVDRALAVLTEEQRQVVVLRYFNHRSHEEIAKIMGKREGAVRALLLRALRHMRKVMVDAAP